VNVAHGASEGEDEGGELATARSITETSATAPCTTFMGPFLEKVVFGRRNLTPLQVFGMYAKCRKEKCRIDRKSCLMLIMKHLLDFNEKIKIRLLQMTNSQKELFEKGGCEDVGEGV